MYTNDFHVKCIDHLSLIFQMGTFKAHDGEYFLEPLMKTDGSEHEDEHNKPHLIYRNEEFKKDVYQKFHEPCEVSGIVILYILVYLYLFCYCGSLSILTNCKL